MLFGVEAKQWVYLLGALMAADVITGYWKAFVLQEISSSVSRRGLTIKFGILVMLCLSAIIEKLDLDMGVPIVAYGALFYCVYELTSILENWVAIGLPMFPQIKTALSVWKTILARKMPMDAAIAVESTPLKTTVLVKQPGVTTTTNDTEDSSEAQS